jgi:hypothetical protein
MVQQRCFDVELDENQRVNVATYMVQLPSELAMNLWKHITSGDKAIENAGGIHKVDLGPDLPTVKEFMMEVLAAKK